MTMPDLFEQLDSPAETGDDWIRCQLSEPDETPSPTPAAGDDGTDTGHEPDLPQEEERIVPPQASGPGAGGDVTAPPPTGAHAIPLPASDDTSPSDDLDDMHQNAIPGFGTDMDADEPARAGHAVRIVLTVLAVVAAVALVGVIAAGAVTASARHGAEQAQAVLREKRPDILFTDICMPGADGLALLAAVRSEFPDRQVTISAMSLAWSPMRSMSVIILSTEEIRRRSLATGCCWSRSLRHSDSMLRSFWSISASSGATRCASSGSASVRALDASAMTSSHSAPISIISLFRSASCSSNRLLISQTSL